MQAVSALRVTIPGATRLDHSCCASLCVGKHVQLRSCKARRHKGGGLDKSGKRKGGKGGKRTFAALGSNVAEGPSLLGRPHSLGGQQAVPPQLCFEPFRALRVGFGLHVA